MSLRAAQSGHSCFLMVWGMEKCYICWDVDALSTLMKVIGTRFLKLKTKIWFNCFEWFLAFFPLLVCSVGPLPLGIFLIVIDMRHPMTMSAGQYCKTT